MKTVFLICIISFLSSCTVPFKGRSPSSDVKENLASIKVGLLKEIYRFALDSQQTARVLGYPITDSSDLDLTQDPSEIENQNRSIADIKQLFDESISSLQPPGLDPQEFRIAVGDYVRSAILSQFTKQEKRQLIGFCFGPRGLDDIYQLSFQLTYACNHFNFLVTKKDIIAALKFIPNSPKGVKYVGERGWHSYSDEDLEHHVRVLTLAIANDKERFIRVFDSLDQKVREKFRHNRHGMSESDKVEPFDLLANYSTWTIIGQTQGQSDYGNLNRIYIGKLVQKSLSRVFQMSKIDPQSDELPTLSVMKKNDRTLFWCASGRFKPKPRTLQDKDGASTYRAYGTDLLEGMAPSFRLSELIQAGRLGFTINCNTMEYKVAIEPQRAEQINPPQPLNFEDQKNIDALITVALVSEMSSTSLTIGKTVLRTLGGWELVEDFEEINTKSAFTRLLPKTDIYIPVSHSMDVNAFHVGTENGYSIKLRREVKSPNGNIKYINATILLPRSEGGLSSSLIMGPESLAELLFARNKDKTKPLFLMNTSCASEKTLFTWMATHRKVLDKRIEANQISTVGEDNTTPHIIGSKRFFATNSLSAIMSHLSFPVGAMDMLAEGHSVVEVVEFLRKDKEYSFSENFMNFVTGYSAKDDELSSKSFEPDYLMDHPELLSTGGYKIRVNRRGLPYELEY